MPSLTHGRGLAAAVIVTLACGAAILTAAFAIVNAALLRQPPFVEADRLAILYLQRNPAGEPPRQERWSFPRFERLRQTQTSFEDVASYSPASVTLSADGDAELEYIERVSGSYFPILRVTASRGRLFDATDDEPSRPSPVAVVSHETWTSRFAGDPSIVGRVIRLNGVPLTIIGVLPAGFSGLSGRSSFWVPRSFSTQITYAEYLTTNQNFISAVGRLRPGVSLEAARRELAVLGTDINRAMPSDPKYPDERVTASATPINDVRTIAPVRRSLLVLIGAVAVLHLLACANAINLLLGRGAARRREYALRLALGSSPRRLMTHVFSRTSGLAAAGGAAGVLLAWWGTSIVAPPGSQWATGATQMAAFDAPVFSGLELAFGAALTALTATLVALPPAWLASRVRVAHGLQTGARSLERGALSLHRPTARGVIIGIEAALAALLVVASGLLLDSVQRMRRVNLGVNADRVLTFWVVPSEVRHPPEKAAALIERLVTAIEQAPGVESVTVDGGGPLAGSASSTLHIAGRPEPGVGQAPAITRHYVAPNHFRTLGIPLLRGRAFTETDGVNTRVTVVSQSAAQRFWPGEDPIGRRVWFGSGSAFNSADRTVEVIGVVGDVRYQPFDRPPNLASFYTPYRMFTFPARMIFVKSAGNPEAIVPDVRRAVATVDPELALQDVRTMTDLLEGSWARRRFDATLFGGFGMAALLLAASGIFAVLAYSVETRRREFGIRIALGAGPGRLIWHVLREGLAFPIVGLAVGLAAAAAFARVLQSSLYETSPHDPAVFGLMTAVLLAAAAAACLGPAWRATRADPIEALRAE
jgi:putative ABC transport system permease protein